MNFVSKREKRLWVTAFLGLLSIYCTLGVVRDWFLMVESTGWGSYLFVLVSSLILLTVVTQWMTSIPNLKEMGVTSGIILVYWFVFSQISFPEERIHIIMYGVVALLIHAALLERSVGGQKIPVSFLIVIVVTSLFGTIDEIIQIQLPNRVFDVHDILYNFVASGMAVGSNASLRWARK
ncbi:MAG: VanZ family protein [Bacteroidetes bacterium]|nr:VanZ family protein [Bacteroidota bacterium]